MKYVHRFYYLLPILLWVLQAIYTFNSMNQLRPDEVYTIRDVLPFQNRALAAAPGSNVTFYASLMALYNLFGFNLFMPKFFRLGVQLISLFCLAALLKKYFGPKHAVLPLITIGLSPTLLYWTLMEAPWGIDLQLFPICLFLLDTLSLKKKWTVITGPVLGWVVTMLSWLSYPTFMFYLPFLAWFQLKKLTGFKNKLAILAGCFASFLMPLTALYVYIIRRDILFYDPKWERGLFTAGGALLFDSYELSKSTAAIFVNLFSRATSYMFEVHSVEFSYYLPIAVVLFIIIIPLKFLNKDKNLRLLGAWCFAVIAANIVLTGFTLDGSGMPGARRNTPILTSLMGLFAITWYLVAVKKLPLKVPQWLPGVILSSLLVHHLVVYPINLVHLKDLSPLRETTWFSLESTPQASFEKLLNELQQKDLYLDCEKQFGSSYPTCYYSSVYAVLTEACMYNNLQCHSIKARFPFTPGYQTLNYELFAQEDWVK